MAKGGKYVVINRIISSDSLSSNIRALCHVTAGPLTQDVKLISPPGPGLGWDK